MLLPELQSGGIPVTQHAPRSGARRTEKGAISVRAASLASVSSRAIASALEQQPVVAGHQLRLRNSSGKVVEVPASNYYLDAAGQPRPFVQDLVALALTRPADKQAAINRELTEAHASHEMSFRVKNPETGHYDKIFKVPVHGSVVPLPEAHFQKLVSSTEPVMRALRAMLQVIYSKPDATAEELGIGHLPPEDQAQVMATIRESIYFEPKLVSPAMKDYPFLSVGGFDAAVGNLENPNPIFFEYNLGTPSGLSNNVQLIDIIREHDPEMFATLANRLPKDDTFQILREAIESNAEAWTGRKDGISVVISPGVYNGAHPDVASISLFSGMPMVNPSDLYEDREGNMRLNTGKLAGDPVVTGIYGRAEESFFLQNNNDGIPIRSPEFIDNPALGKKWGLELESGVVYDWKYNDKEEIVGVHLDAAGKPKLQAIYESIGRDPSRPELEPGSFARAILGKKLYYSGIGGRVVDDKRVFQVVAEKIAPAFARSADAPIARPPRTLKLEEYGQLYASKNLENYVIKEPDKSGGDGVFLMVNLSEEKRAAVVEAVKKNPSRYIVQEFAELAVMLSPEPSGAGAGASGAGEQNYASIAADWRIFSIMDANGTVRGGPNSLLLRAAKPFSASTNTSQGGCYGIGLILGDAKPDAQIPSSVLPQFVQQQHLGASRKADLIQFLDALNGLTSRADPANGSQLPRDGWSTLVAQFQREVMDVLGRDFAPLMSVLRAFDDGEINQATLFEELLAYRALLFAATDYPVAGVENIVSAELSKYAPLASGVSLAGAAPDRASILADHFSLSYHPSPIVVRERGEISDLDVAAYMSSTQPAVQDAIRELMRFGGELRLMRASDKAGTDWTQLIPPASHFTLDESGRPIIGIDMTQDYALSALAASMAHFQVWREHREAFARAGAGPAEAALKARDKIFESEVRIESAERALKAEMAADADQSSALNRGGYTKALSPADPGFVMRMSYPRVEGVRDLLLRGASDSSAEAAAKKHLSKMVIFALSKRQLGHRQLIDAARTAETPAESYRNMARADALAARRVFDLIFDPGSVERFRADGTLGRLASLFDEVYAASPYKKYALGETDARRLSQQ